MRKIRIGTRGSKLAILQASFVALELRKKFPEFQFELIKITTTGDKLLNVPLAKIGDRGLFTKELELRLLRREIDLVVHSFKDLPVELSENFKIAAVTKRIQPFDAFVSNKFSSFRTLPKNSIIGTSSLRRAAQLLMKRPDLQIKNLRGNIDTRLKKLDEKNFDAIILSAAGLERLGSSFRIRELLTEMIPAAGQGALAIEVRRSDEKIFELVEKLNDRETEISCRIERDFLREIGGNCQTPIGILASVEENKIKIRAQILSLDGQQFVEKFLSIPIEKIDGLGQKVARNLLESGGRQILEDLKRRRL